MPHFDAKNFKLVHYQLLGLEVKDVVTGLRGIVTSISFDLNGSVQAAANPGLDKDGKVQQGTWVDTKSLFVLCSTPVRERPAFQSIPDGRELPRPSSLPSK